jgi:hypothetical protein
MKSNKDHVVYSDIFSSKRKCKPEGYHAVCIQYVALSCCLSAKQMAKSKQCKVPTKQGPRPKQGQRLDHVTKLSKNRLGACQPTELSTSGGRSLGLRPGHSLPNNQRGLMQSETGCDRKQVKSRLIEHLRRERKNGARNTSHEKEKETSPNKDKSSWKTQTNDETRHPYLKNVTSSERERELTKSAV